MAPAVVRTAKTAQSEMIRGQALDQDSPKIMENQMKRRQRVVKDSGKTVAS
jgi:hypothetical protein